MKTKNAIWRERLLFFLLGAISLGIGGLLLGAASDFNASTLNYGRYQISSWATRLDQNSGAVGAFVMDTVSGETRTVYMRTYGKPPGSRAVKNDLKKSFHSID